ncbi:hypothetical protein [Nostoc sp. FACHB-280]|uniref:hypothetical protein n=1 Tax=Nostoc sp. FACHB-280 TaxID=2692839 RepID=UPI00168B6C96|nr:hypothetical protein [Nostoc sp. FACHB-280]MBD2493050.1 hypothetical protein [Nostoc sp. FACHB-280]
MKLFNDLVTVAESTAPVISVAFLSSILSYGVSLVPINQSNNKCVQKWNFSFHKFPTNRQLTQNTTPLQHTKASLAMKSSVCSSGSNSLAYSRGTLLGGADTKMGTARTSFSVTAVNNNC